MKDIYIIGASADQTTMIETIQSKHPELHIVLCNSFCDIENIKIQQINNPFASEPLQLLNCYIPYDDIRELPHKEEYREKRQQFENRSRYTSRMSKFNKSK